MDKYTVICDFSDLQDDRYIYKTGDEYPRNGYSPSAKRILELTSTANVLKKILIEKSFEEKETVEKKRKKKFDDR